ncbi:hypothetical protein XB05_11080 [Xanthomonas arboricola]|nr:hypothetical protein XB05_11080 [Xanthomonas arboricola]
MAPRTVIRVAVTGTMESKLSNALEVGKRDACWLVASLTTTLPTPAAAVSAIAPNTVTEIFIKGWASFGITHA